MPRTITIDAVELMRLQFLKTPNGNVQICAEYHLRAGSEVIKAVSLDITVRLSGARRAAALALFDAVAQDISTAELA